MVMDALYDESEIIVLTFWETKEGMDRFYHFDNDDMVAAIVDKLCLGLDNPRSERTAKYLVSCSYVDKLFPYGLAHIF